MFLTPQYNGGYPASLKNAIDFLFAEWRDKPAVLVSHGGHGGGMAAEQLAHVLRFVGMDLSDPAVADEARSASRSLADKVDLVPAN